MNLNQKYLLVLNGIILTMWTMYTTWSLKETEAQFMKAEVSSITHMAIGLGLLIKHQLDSHDAIEGLQKEMGSLLPQQTGLDIMVIDDTFTVRLATNESLIGQKWVEGSIKKVLSNESPPFEVVVTKDEHLHENRRAIDASIGIKSASSANGYAIHVARWLDHISGALNQQLISHALFALTLLIVIGGAVNLLTYRVILKPLHAMNHQLTESGWLSSHPELKGGSELVQLQAALDDAMTRIDLHTTDLNEQLKRFERLAVLGRMSAMLAHEIRNPLHIVRGTAETIVRRAPDMAEFGLDIKEEVDRVERLIEELLDYTKQTPPRLEPVDADALANRVVTRIKQSANAGQLSQLPNIEVGKSHTRLMADPVMLEQALTNLLQNAVEASAPDLTIKINIGADDENIVFIVEDEGSGINTEESDKILDPFYSTKATGTGLGLAIVDKIASLHQGQITVYSRREKGTVAKLTIPKGALDG